MVKQLGTRQSGIVMVDFDGVIACYTGWCGETEIGKPIEGAREYIDRVRLAGYTVIVFTARRRTDVIEAWLVEYDFPKLKVTSTKVPALLYLDDRAHKFDGNWEEAFEAIQSKPWWKSDVTV